MLQMTAAGYRFPSCVEPSVLGVDLCVGPGEFVLLTGPTGSGKSTLLRLAGGLLQRHGSGEVLGSVRLGGDDPAVLRPAERCVRVGFVNQSPRRQVVTGRVGDEVAFALESAGWEPERARSRVLEMLELVGLPLDLERSTDALSGGETQRLMVAAALAGGASLLLLDEPLAHLDPRGARDLVSLLARLADGGVAVVVVEHRLPQLLNVVSRVVVMDQGQVVSDRPSQELDYALIRRLGLRLPKELAVEDFVDGEAQDGAESGQSSLVLASFDGVSFRYPGGSTLALSEIRASVRSGDRIAILGENGAGKSTLLGCLSGAHRVASVSVPGRCVRVPQDPDLALFCETVRAELSYGPSEARSTGAAAAALVDTAASAMSIVDLLSAAPHSLSRGQRLRVAVGAALSCRPDILLLDEPTAGQDHDQVERMMAALRSEAGPGALLFATHDIDLALRHATRIWVLDGGLLVVDDVPREAAEQVLALLGPGALAAPADSASSSEHP